jgi:hypothetical protein
MDVLRHSLISKVSMLTPNARDHLPAAGGEAGC